MSGNEVEEEEWEMKKNEEIIEIIILRKENIKKMNKEEIEIW